MFYLRDYDYRAETGLSAAETGEAMTVPRSDDSSSSDEKRR